MEETASGRHWTAVATATCAVIAAAIGTVVVLGWNLGSEALIAVHAGFIPVQYNTALGFLCCALALLALLRNRRWLAAVAAAATAVMASMTAVEYLAGVDLPIDTFFFNGLAVGHVSGRPAPNTVVAFLCITGALLLLVWQHRIPRGVDVAASLAAVVAAVGLVALTGYVASIPTAYQWRGQKPIAVLTTAAFVALAAGAIALAWHSWTDRPRESRVAPGFVAAWENIPPWLSSPVFVLLMAVCGMIANAMWDVSRVAVLPQPRRSLVFAMVLMLVFGVTVATALVLVIRLAQSAQRRSQDLELLNSALAISEERYRSLTIATAQVIWTTDANGMVCGDMPTWREYTGATCEQLQGWGWLDSLHPEDRAPAARAWSDAVARRSLYETEYRLRRRDGEYRHVWVRGVPVVEAAGAVREWVGTCTDMTERKQAEQQILQASRYARSLLEASLDPLVTIGKDGRIMDVNRATEQVTGITRQRLIGSDFCDYFTEPAKAREGYQRVFAEGTVRDYPLAIRSALGKVTEVVYNATLFQDQEGRVEGIFAAARDITERKRAQEELQNFAQELERSNSELQEFAFVASHDLQEPLRKITAFSERLRDRAAGRLDETSLDYLNRMHNAAARMGTLIDSLLEYSRVGTRALPFEEVDLASLMLGILADLEQRIFESRATIKVHRLPNVHGDPTQLRQLLQNLLANALKFHAPNTSPCIHVRSAAADGRWRISVSDNGIGFDPAYTERIFRPFQRLHGRNEFEGSGMGLAICRKIAQRHGAAIAVTTAPGHGATFTVSLPAAPERTEPCPQLPSESSSPKTMTMTTC